jgi:hypothetical protein
MGLLKKIKHKTHHHSPPSIPTPHFDPPHINPPKVPAAIIKTPIAINYAAKVVKQNIDHTITETKSETLTIVDAIKSTAVKLVDKVSGDKKEHSDEIIDPIDPIGIESNNWLLYGAIGFIGLMIVY